jgi:hypothetical protein
VTLKWATAYISGSYLGNFCFDEKSLGSQDTHTRTVVQKSNIGHLNKKSLDIRGPMGTI